MYTVIVRWRNRLQSMDYDVNFELGSRSLATLAVLVIDHISRNFLTT